ncbi:hypothetical protein [Brucella pseudogrignonensis]|nr:hypothetical protein [Brucella pseudogrignonensis]
MTTRSISTSLELTGINKMTYYRTAADARAQANFNHSDKCVACDKPLAGPTIVYDLYGTDQVGNAFHRDCAFEMAQRIICDAWPNRRHPKEG